MIESIIARQTELIAALDASDADAVMAASRALERLLADMPRDGNIPDPERLAFGLKQTEAARIRVKYLTAWNRQKIDRLAQMRGQASPNVYTPKPR